MSSADKNFKGELWETSEGKVVPFDPNLNHAARYQNDADCVAELEAQIVTLRAQVGQARLIFDSAIDYAIMTMDINGHITSWNAGATRIMGYAEAEILGRSGEIIFTSEDRANNRFSVELRRAMETGRASNERWHLRRDGTRFWASGMMMPLMNQEGEPNGFLNILRDRTDARAEVERRELLMAEMNHRIKNTFAIVQAVACQTRRHASTVAEYQSALDNRLMVLSRSHDVLIKSDWDDAPLQDVIDSALAAYSGEAGRVTIGGPSVLLRSNLIVMISLAFHELATNAVKYGALSVPDGRVGIAWTITPTRKGPNRIDIVWQESGGPAVQQPKRRGFGSQLLERGMPLGGTVQLNFHPAGVQCHICLPPDSEG